MNDCSHLYTGQDNAMTEIALALAMGFFSLMVLTLVSIGNGPADEEESPDFASIAVAQQSQPSSKAVPVSERDVFVIYTDTAFLDSKGQPVRPEELTVPAGGRLVLVVSPDSPLSEIIQARSRFPQGRVVVAEMDQAWLRAMRSGGAKR